MRSPSSLGGFDPLGPPFVRPPVDAGLSSSCADPTEGDLSPPAAGEDVGGDGAVGTLLAGGVSGAAEAAAAAAAAGRMVCSSDLCHCAMTSRASPGPPAGPGGGGGGKSGCLPAANCAAAAAEEMREESVRVD